MATTVGAEPADSSPSPPAGSPGASTTFTRTQIIAMSVLVLGLVFALTMVLVFHYTASSDVTAVLGVVIPVLTLVLGGIAGNTAGKATGSSGKQAVQQKLDTANTSLRQAAGEAHKLNAKWSSISKELKTKMSSPAGDSHLLTLSIVERVRASGDSEASDPAAGGIPQTREERVVDLEDMDHVTASLASLGSILKPVE